MKNQNVLIAVLAIAAVAAGCNKNEPSSEYSAETNSVETNAYGFQTNEMGSTQQMENAAEGATNAWQNTSNASVSAWGGVKEGTSNAWEKTKNATTNAWGGVKNTFESNGSTNDFGTNDYSNYTYAQKDAFVAQAQSDLSAMDQKITELSDKAANASESVKADAQTKIQDLRDKRADLDQKLASVKNASEDQWDDAKAGFQQSYDDVKNSLQQAWDWLTNKMSQ